MCEANLGMYRNKNDDFCTLDCSSHHGIKLLIMEGSCVGRVSTQSVLVLKGGVISILTAK